MREREEGERGGRERGERKSTTNKGVKVRYSS